MGMPVMTNHRRLSAGLIAAAVAWMLSGEAVLPAAATELSLPPLHKAATVATVAKKSTPRPHLVRVASEAPLPTLVSGSRVASYPLIIGVAY